MSKRTTIFLSLLALITALLSVCFIIISFCVDVFAGNETASLTFEEIRTAFDLIAEYTAMGIIIYAFCRYGFKSAKRSLLIALGSFLFSFLFQIIATGAVEFKTSSATSGEIWSSIGMYAALGAVGLFIERILPCLLISFIVIICTRKGITKSERTIRLIVSISISSVIIYLLNAVPTLILHIMEIIDLGGTTEIYFKNFVLYYIIPHLVIYFKHYVLVFAVFWIVYFVCKKFEESAPIKKHKKVKIASSIDATQSEE